MPSSTNNFFCSPHSFKYESPSRLLNLHTPERTPIDKYILGGQFTGSNFKSNNR